MARGTYEIPRQFNNEDRWIKYLTNKGMKALIIGAVVTIVLYKILGLIHIGVVGAIIGVVITIFMVFVCMYKVSSSNFKEGAGQDLATIMIRVIKRKTKKVIYTKCLNNEVNEIANNSDLGLIESIIAKFKIL